MHLRATVVAALAGVGGLAVAAAPAVAAPLEYSTFLHDAFGGGPVALAPDGDIVFAGKVLHGSGTEAFVLRTDATLRTLRWATVMGDTDGTTSTTPSDIAVGADGSTYVTGSTNSPNLPTTPDAPDPEHDGTNQDAFVVRFSPTGATDYGTYLGGNADGEDAGAIAVDPNGNMYVSGFTRQNGMPVTPDALGASDPAPDGNWNFVVKLVPGSPSYGYATRWTHLNQITALATDETGAVYVVGGTRDPAFPISPHAPVRYQPSAAAAQGVVAKLGPAGRRLKWSTFLGGAAEDGVADVAISPSKQVYVTGLTTSTDFPTTPGAYDRTANGGQDAFVARISRTGRALQFSTFLGGELADIGTAIGLDAERQPYVIGTTNSQAFPTTAGAFDRTSNGPWYHRRRDGTLVYDPAPDVFVAKLSRSGADLRAATYLGGHGSDSAHSAAVTPSGTVVLTAWAFWREGGPAYPTTPDASDTTQTDSNGAITKLTP